MGPLLVQAKIRGEGQEWARLIPRTAQGDQAALGTMYDKTSVRIYDLILRILGDRASAEEVTLTACAPCVSGVGQRTASRDHTGLFLGPEPE